MNLLVTGAWSGAEKYFDNLKSMGHKVKFLQQEKDALPCDYSWVEGVICNGLFLHHPVEQFSNLRYIQLTSAGYDRVPMDYIRSHGIEIHNARGVYSLPMAEFALCGVLQLYKESRFFITRQRRHMWEKNRHIRELRGSTVCIVGFGSVGQACAEVFAALGCRILGVDLQPGENKFCDVMYCFPDLERALEQSDVVILTLPLTDETRGLFGEKLLFAIKPGAILVNIARGGLVDKVALIVSLESGHLGGAVLDVFDEEPLPAWSILWDLPNVVLTPHNSFVGDGNEERLWGVIRSSLEGVL